MMKRRYLLCASLMFGCASNGATEAKKKPGEMEVKLCDDHTTVQVAEGPKTKAEGAAIAAELMRQWYESNPDSNWLEMERKAHALKPAATNEALIATEGGNTYGRITRADVTTWKNETEKFALLGSAIFHDGDKLKSTIAVSCDMCHPHAANTHPETYPKFQRQLGRVALLRDMINWCIEHPVRGVKLEADSTEMRALEAYIYAQRTGTPLEYGKN